MRTINMVPDSACYKQIIIFYAYNNFTMLKFQFDFTGIREDFNLQMDLNDEDGIWDSVMLEPLTEDTFISNLNCRYDSNTYYVSLIFYNKIHQCI